MENTKQNKMGTANITKLIVTMSLPAMFSMLIQSLYNIVDSMFVAQISENALTAVSLAFPIQTLIIAVAVGTGIGLNSVISRKLGEKNFAEANSAADHGIILGILNWVVFAIFGLFFTKMFFEAFTNNAEVVAMGDQYVTIVTVFSFGVFIQINIEKMLQATGNMIYPMLFQLVGAITNIILDPIMIFGLFGFPKMGISGAAIATVIGQITAMVFSIIVLYTKNHSIKINFKHFKLNFPMVKQIYAVGFPSIIMQSIGAFLIMGLNTILIAFSEAAVSVLGVYYKLQSFIFMPVFGLMQGTMPIMGYNFGAKNKKRLIKAYKVSLSIGACIMIAGTLIFNFFPRELLMMFNPSPQMLEIGIPALRIISSCFVFAAIGIITSTLFQSIGDGMKSLYISLIRQLVVIYPVAWLMAKFVGLDAVWFAFVISEVVAAIISLVLLIFVYRNKMQYLEKELS